MGVLGEDRGVMRNRSPSLPLSPASQKADRSQLRDHIHIPTTTGSHGWWVFAVQLLGVLESSEGASAGGGGGGGAGGGETS